MELLKQYKLAQNEERLKMGDKWLPTDFVFTNSDTGKPIFPNRPTVWFSEFLKRHDLPKITFHQLRHTNASLLLAQNVDIAVLSKRLGHSKISVTLDIYSHALKSKDKEAADKMDALILPKKDRNSIL
jgi:integrase